tara:strand:- start:206 stop:910 length:705 start_codon:yes stop_codon:yes gene_type:complete
MAVAFASCQTEPLSEVVETSNLEIVDLDQIQDNETITEYYERVGATTRGAIQCNPWWPEPFDCENEALLIGGGSYDPPQFLPCPPCPDPCTISCNNKHQHSFETRNDYNERTITTIQIPSDIAHLYSFPDDWNVKVVDKPNTRSLDCPYGTMVVYSGPDAGLTVCAPKPPDCDKNSCDPIRLSFDTEANNITRAPHPTCRHMYYCYIQCGHHKTCEPKIQICGYEICAEDCQDN